MKTPTIDTPISEFMTTSPLRVEETATLKIALEIMHRSDIRHLPVVAKGHLVGLVSHRDITAALAKGTIDPASTQIKEVMGKKPYTVSPKTSLHDVTGVMVLHKYGSVIIAEGDMLLGIFTSIDAMRALREITGKSSKYV